MQEQESAEEFDVFPYVFRLIFRTASGMLLTLSSLVRHVLQFFFCPILLRRVMDFLTRLV